MTSYKKSQEEYSRDVYEAFQAIAVTSDMIHRRRHDWLLYQTLVATQLKIRGQLAVHYIVGSQVEGSTTIGMHSDTDTVNRIDFIQVVLKLGAWQKGKVNLLAFKDETTPPQFYKLCWLQPTTDGKQEYARVPAHDTDVVDREGRVLVSSIFLNLLLNIVFNNMVMR